MRLYDVLKKIIQKKMSNKFEYVSVSSTVTYQQRPVVFYRIGNVAQVSFHGVSNASIGSYTIICNIPERFRPVGVSYFESRSPSGNHFRFYMNDNIFSVYVYNGPDANIVDDFTYICRGDGYST